VPRLGASRDPCGADRHYRLALLRRPLPGAIDANPGAFKPGASTLFGAGQGKLDALTFIPWGFLDPFYAAVVQATEEAVLNALVASAEMVGLSRAPHPGPAARPGGGNSRLAPGGRVGTGVDRQSSTPRSGAFDAAGGVLTVSRGIALARRA
jgi:hypothetical protein